VQVKAPKNSPAGRRALGGRGQARLDEAAARRQARYAQHPGKEEHYWAMVTLMRSAREVQTTSLG
jgi:hypothetical protein